MHKDDQLSLLKSLPKFYMDPLKKSLVAKTLETEVAKTRKTSKASSASTRRFRRAKSIAAGVIAACVAVTAGYAVILNHAGQPGQPGHTTTAASHLDSTTSNAAKDALGFEPQLPQDLSGLKLSVSGVNDDKYKGQEMAAFTAQFIQSDGAPIAHSVQNPNGKRTPMPILSIFEVKRDTLSGTIYGMPTNLRWKGSFQVGGQTYYTSDMNGNVIGFVKNHVAYVLSSMFLSTQQMKPYAEHLTAPATMQYFSQTYGPDYDDAVGHLSFKPIVPSNLPFGYTLVRSGAQVYQGTSKWESLNLTYHYNHSAKHWFSIIEWTITASSAASRSSVAGNEISWVDKIRNLELTVSGGGVSKNTLEQIANTLKNAKS